MRLKHSMDDDRQYGPSMNRGMGHPHGTPDFEGERAKIESLANQATEYRDGMLQSVRGDETLTPDQIQAREGAINDSYNEYMGGLRGEYDRINAEEAAYYAENGYDSWSYAGENGYAYEDDGMGNAGYDAGMGNSDYGYEDDGMSNVGYDVGSYDPGSHESEGMGNTGYGYGGDGDTGYTSGESSGQDVGSGMDM